MDNYRDLFIVPSAILTQYGTISQEDRLKQTIETLSSIRKYAPQSDIIIIELSEQKIYPEIYDVLAQFDIKEFFYFHDHPIVMEHYQHDLVKTNLKGDFIKNLNEIFATKTVLNHCNQHNTFANYRRIFKISSRYSLLPQFSQDFYNLDSLKGLCVFLREDKYHLDMGREWLPKFKYMTRLWSFDPSLSLKLENWFDTMYDMLLKYYEERHYIDIEYLLYFVIPRSHCIYINKVFVTGIEGGRKVLIEE